MNTRAIDFITEDFYESLSFMDGELPDLETVRSLFHGEGLLVNNSTNEPLSYTAESFTKEIEEQIEDGWLLQFMQREVYSKTEIFGRIAQRMSVYEYSYSYLEKEDLQKGVNYIQFIQDGDEWRITAMAWNDESENFKVPEEEANG